MGAPYDIVDRRLLTRRRDRAAGAAHEREFLLARVADDLIERLSTMRRSFPTAVNLGAHHGLLGRRLRAVPTMATVIEVDASPRLLARCLGLRVLADEQCLPFGARTLDLVVSGLALHWVNDLPGTLVQVRRALRPGGLLLASLLGGRSLHELREAFFVAEDEIEGGASPRVLPFADVRELGALLQRAGFALPVADSDTVTVTYADPLALMRDLKAMGASNMLSARRRTFMKRATLARAVAVYAERFGRTDGRVPATFEIITLTGQAPSEADTRPRPVT